jgi:hypothetical protein
MQSVPVVSRVGSNRVFNRARVQALHWMLAPEVDVVDDEFVMKTRAFLSPAGRKVWTDALDLHNAQPKAYRPGQRTKYRFIDSRECREST